MRLRAPTRSPKRLPQRVPRRSRDILGRRSILIGVSRRVVAATFAAMIWQGVWVAIPGAIGATSLDQTLRQRMSVTWSNQHLQEAIARIEQTYDLTIWLDRRVDPNSLLQAELSDAPLLDALEVAAESVGAVAVPFGNVIFVGRRSTATELAPRAETLRRKLQAASPRLLRAALKKETWSCDRLSEPRRLVVAEARKAAMEIENPEAIPHDLWDARRLPPMAAVDRLVLLLAGFDLTCELTPDQRGLRVVVAPREPRTAANSAPPRAASDSASPGRAPPSAKVASEERQITLRVQNQPLGAVLDRLAQQLRVEFRWEPGTSSSASRKRLVSCNAEQANLERVLRELTAPLGLSCRQTGDVVEIGSRE